jgi:hypothetical protein
MKMVVFLISTLQFLSEQNILIKTIFSKIPNLRFNFSCAYAMWQDPVSVILQFRALSSAGFGESWCDRHAHYGPTLISSRHDEEREREQRLIVD